jgi:hypothetical protein
LNARTAWWSAATLAATGACGAESPVGPDGPPVQAGLYVLSDLGGASAPYVFERAVYGDTAVVTLTFAFDSVRIVNDSTFERHFRREYVVTRPHVPAIVQASEEFVFGGLILDRGDEVKLTVRSGSLPGGHDLAYFTPTEGGAGLERLVRTRQYSCDGSRCQILSEQRVRARYARQ